jgi:hypothetical protein
MVNIRLRKSLQLNVLRQMNGNRFGSSIKFLQFFTQKSLATWPS